MSIILKQRKFLRTQQFEITEGSLKVTIKSPFNLLEDEFTFEEITKKTTKKKAVHGVTLALSLLFVCFLGISLYSHFTDKKGSAPEDIAVYVFLATITPIITYFTYENNIYLFLFNNRTLKFYANSPKNVEVTAFLESLKDCQKKFLLDRYAQASDYLTTEQLANNLKWLWERHIIDDTELDQLRKSLLNIKNDKNNSIGFRISPN